MGPVLDNRALVPEQVAAGDHRKHSAYSSGLTVLVDLLDLVDLAGLVGQESTRSARTAETRKTKAQVLVMSTGTVTATCAAVTVRISKEGHARLSETCVVGVGVPRQAMPALVFLVLSKDAVSPRATARAEEEPGRPWKAEASSYCLAIGDRKSVLGDPTMARRYRGCWAGSHGFWTMSVSRIAVAAVR